MPLHPRTCSLLYSVSCLLDALDGVAARYFQQSTQFGAVLDMVTDRCTTACLLVFLSSAWPRWALLFQGLISLDLASHYMHMYATLTMAGSGQSHKKVDQGRSRLLHLYYTNKVCATPAAEWKEAYIHLSERSLRFLRLQRTLLHCPLPPFLLLPHPFPLPPPHQQLPRRLHTTRVANPSCVNTVRRARKRVGNGAGQGEQDGQLLALGDCGREFPSHGGEAVPQRSAAGQGEQMACGGRH